MSVPTVAPGRDYPSPDALQQQPKSSATAPFRLIELVRGLWGAALLAAPRLVLSEIHGVDADRKAVVVTRILGARHLTQAALSGINPSPEIIATGTWVDSVHSLTALALAAADRRRARAGITDAIIAAAWMLFGAHNLTTGATPPPTHQRRRDQLAQQILPRLPGGQRLWASAQRARHQHQSPRRPTLATPANSSNAMTSTSEDHVFQRFTPSSHIKGE
jgi:hypothetical protein